MTWNFIIVSFYLFLTCQQILAKKTWLPTSQGYSVDGLTKIPKNHFFNFFFFNGNLNYTLIWGNKCFLFLMWKQIQCPDYDICNIVDVSYVFLLSESIEPTWNLCCSCKKMLIFFPFIIKNTIHSTDVYSIFVYADVKDGVPNFYRKIHWKTLALKSLFNKVEGQVTAQVIFPVYLLQIC